ncbi:hypothetical protein EV139_3014 [Leucobacter luti]|uniref:Methionine aminopeptidase n=2 Tax=Leucobacter luti TaxID=340320 RepID=A0A4V2FNA2_9MICO|nr:hypothetical protein EV139_3014 [Leucobacter luti]
MLAGTCRAAGRVPGIKFPCVSKGMHLVYEVHAVLTAREGKSEGNTLMSKREWGIDDPEETYWFNTHTGLVEDGPQSLSIDRIGPFTTREEALHAQSIIAERARVWREEDDADDRLR